MDSKEKRSILEITQDNSFSNMFFGRIIPAQKVLVLAPHCDDELLGCGGTILRYLQDKTRVIILYLTLDKEEKRKVEAINAWRNFPNLTQKFLTIEDSKLVLNRKIAIDKISDLIVLDNPDIIFTPWVYDMHKDHSYSSIYLADSLKKLAKKRNLEQNIVFYEVNFPLYSNYSVNITRFMQNKLNILKLYKSQNIGQLEKVIVNLNQYRASQIGLKQIKWAEGFYVVKVNIFCLLIEKFVAK
jgi:N-acetylglucosamine malate deacetylase 1